MEHKKELQY